MTIAEMITELDNGLLPANAHDPRTVAEVHAAGVIDDNDVRGLYAAHAGRGGLRQMEAFWQALHQATGD